MLNQMMQKLNYVLSPRKPLKSARLGLKTRIGTILHAESDDAKIELYTQPKKTTQISSFWPENVNRDNFAC